MLVFLLCLITFLYILARENTLVIDGSASGYENTGEFNVYALGFKVFYGKIHIEHNDNLKANIIIEHSAKRDEVHLNANKDDEKSIFSVLANPLLSRMCIDNVDFKAHIGNKNDAFATTILLGSIKIVICGALSFVSARYDADIKAEFIPIYNENKLYIEFNLKMSICLIDLAIGFIKMVAKDIKKNKLRRDNAAVKQGEKI